jgi:hypothetical protein
MRRLPDGFDGNTCPYIFTWSTERPNKVWAMGSGTSAYYNTDKEGNANTKMDRNFEDDTFEIYATRKFRFVIVELWINRTIYIHDVPFKICRPCD